MTVIQRARRRAAFKRRRRVFEFLESHPRPVNIIDLGGTVSFWKRIQLTPGDGLKITLVNNHHMDKTNIAMPIEGEFIREVRCDVMTLRQSDYAAYDVVFSNSMLEHLSSSHEQALLCDEIETSGKSYFLQTPSKFSLVDPHFPRLFAPFFALYPRGLQATLLVLDAAGKITLANARRRMHYYRPLGRRQLQSLLPTAKIVRDSVALLTTSLIAQRHASTDVAKTSMPCHER